MLEKELSIYDIRYIGRGRFIRKLWKSPITYLVLVFAVAFMLGGMLWGAFTAPAPEYTLPSGEVVMENGNTLIVDGSIVVERDNPVSTWTAGFTLMWVGFGLLVASIIYVEVHEERARDKIMEEWLAAGYQPKATDV